MVFPLATVFANNFIGYNKSRQLNEHSLNKPKLYLRYVDDILATLDNEQDSLNSLNFLNNKHLTVEEQVQDFFMY